MRMVAGSGGLAPVLVRAAAYAPRHDCRCDREDHRTDADSGGSSGGNVGGVPGDLGADAGPGVELSSGRAPEGLYKQGHNVMLYKDDVPNVEVGVQVSGSFGPAGHVVASTLPGGLVATATHTGPIAEIGDTHQAVCEWSKANGYRLAGPRWEIYGDPDPSSGDFDVQVFWSLVTPIDAG